MFETKRNCRTFKPLYLSNPWANAWGFFVFVTQPSHKTDQIWPVLATYWSVFLLVMGFIATDRLGLSRQSTGKWAIHNLSTIYQQSINFGTSELPYFGTFGEVLVELCVYEHIRINEGQMFTKIYITLLTNANFCLHLWYCITKLANFTRFSQI